MNPTIDIYKYQSLYRRGLVDKPVSHLFIISDEFAELKQQQPGIYGPINFYSSYWTFSWSSPYFSNPKNPVELSMIKYGLTLNLEYV